MKRISLVILFLLPLLVVGQIKRPFKVVYPTPTVFDLTTPVELQNQTFTLTPASIVTNQTTFPMRSRFREYIPNGTTGYVKCRSASSGMSICLSKDPFGFATNDTYLVSKNKVNNKVEAVVTDAGNVTNYYTLDYDYTSFVYFKVTITSTQVLFQFSNDDITYGHDVLMTRVESGDLYVKTYYGDNLDTLTELKQFGMSLNGGL